MAQTFVEIFKDIFLETPCKKVFRLLNLGYGYLERHFAAFENNEQHNEPDLTRNLSSCATFLLGRLILYIFIQL